MSTEDVRIEDHLDQAMTAYGLYVAQDRALPQSDGLKPVQRRALWAGHLEKLGPSKFSKCANVVGTAMQYHPHGDTAIYGAMVTMTKQRYPLFLGRGNFGSPFGDAAGAMRYTEIGISRLGQELFSQIDVAPMVDSYDGRSSEPQTVPTPFPLMLMNGSSGIGVGTQTSIPPHNLTELLSACLAMLEDPDCDPALHVRGPDVGAGFILMSEDLPKLYYTGAASIDLYCDYKWKVKGRNFEVVVTDLVPGWNFESFENFLSGLGTSIHSFENETSKDGTCIRITGDAQRLPAVVDALKVRQHYSLNIVHNGKILEKQSLKSLLHIFLDQRKDTVEKVYSKSLETLAGKMGIVDARIWAVTNSGVIKVVQDCDSESAARDLLMSHGLTSDQATLILDTPLRRLLRFNLAKLESEKAQLQQKVDYANWVLANPWEEVATQLRALREDYGDERKTRVLVQGEYDAQYRAKVEKRTSIFGIRGGSYHTSHLATSWTADKQHLVCAADELVTIIGSKGTITRGSKLDLDGTDAPDDVVALVGDTFDYICFVDTRGRICVVEQDAWKSGKSYKDIFKTKSTVSTAFGVNEGDELLVWYTKGAKKDGLWRSKALPRARKSSRGHAWVDAVKKGESLTSVSAWPQGSMLVTGRGLAAKDPSTAKHFLPAHGRYLTVNRKGQVKLRGSLGVTALVIPLPKER